MAWRSPLPAKWQCWVIHFYWNVFTVVPKSKVKEVAAYEKVDAVVKKLKKK
ncbi:MAG: hypothetical protein ACOC1E_00610 [Marinilabiliaceae bacterium]